MYIKQAYRKLDETLGKESKNSQLHKDSVTGEQYSVDVERMPDGSLRIAEVTADGKPKTEVILTKNADGTFYNNTVTLNFEGDRYEGKNANPGIVRQANLPQTASTIVQLLLGANPRLG